MLFTTQFEEEIECYYVSTGTNLGPVLGSITNQHHFQVAQHKPTSLPGHRLGRMASSASHSPSKEKRNTSLYYSFRPTGSNKGK